MAVPRYTSYPPANHFVQMTEEAYREGVLLSNDARDGHRSFYFHIPFCRSLCHYCACNSYAMRGEQGLKTYVEALHREIELVVPNFFLFMPPDFLSPKSTTYSTLKKQKCGNLTTTTLKKNEKTNLYKSYSVTVLQCYSVTVLQCYSVTVLHLGIKKLPR